MSTLSVTTAFKTRVHLNHRQCTIFTQWAGARRVAYNFALNLCFIYLEECERTGRSNKLLFEINQFDKFFNASKYPLGKIRKGKGGGLMGTGLNEWIRRQNIPSSACQIAIKYDLKQAWQRAFKGLGRTPRFQSRFRRTSFTLSTADFKEKFIHNHNRITLPKSLGEATLGDPIPYLDYKLGNTSFSRSGDKWYVSFTLTIPADEYYRQSANRKPIVGIDLGVALYAATSDGNTWHAPDKLSQLEKRKKYINRLIGRILHKNLQLVVRDCERCHKVVTGIHDKKRLCHDCREKFKLLEQSRRLKKYKHSISRISAKQNTIRENMCHQLTTSLVKQYERVVIEDLKVKNMTASAKGNTEVPGKNVKQKSRLNRSLLNVAPYRVRSQLEYKTGRWGGTVVAVDPKNTSRQCPECGHIDKNNRKSQSVFHCIQCGHEANADVNAAINIKRRATEPLSKK
jgi:putative transposase